MGNVLGLKSRPCLPDAALLDETLRERFRQQVPGWRVQNNSQGKHCIRQDWNAKDGAAAAQLQQQITELAAAQGHAVGHTDVIGNTVVVELSTAAAGELRGLKRKGVCM
jgi:pterin-4a-carbinolamine dehydratase